MSKPSKAVIKVGVDPSFWGQKVQLGLFLNKKNKQHLSIK